MRRLPVFLLLDVSDSMAGDSHHHLQQGLERLAKSLRQDPHALETVYLSVIAFAGQARTLAPLIDLPTFYTPRLPIGSGTSLGLALNHLMAEIDRQVVATTSIRRGDWKPIVYLLTDGKPTDNYQPAIQRWQQDYANRATLIAVGLGPYADTTILSRFANEVLRYNGEDEADFTRFMQWVTLSVRSQSLAVENKECTGTGLVSLQKSAGVLEVAGDKPVADQDCVVLRGRCQQRKSLYLLKYDRMPDLAEMGIDLSSIGAGRKLYHVTGCYPVDEDYFQWCGESGQEPEPSIDASALVGGAGCPYCGNRFVFGLCACGRLFCVDGAGPAQCPWCNKSIQMNVSRSGGDDFSVARSRG